MERVDIYDGLNEKIKRDLQIAKERDSFLYYNIENLFYLIEKCQLGKKDSSFENLPFISNEKAVQLTENFLYSCSKTFGQLFQNDKSEVIKFSEEKSCIYVYRNIKRYLINIKNTNTINDGRTLVHEFFHILDCDFNGSKVRKCSQGSLSETLPITSELFFGDYLKSKGFSESDVSLINGKRENHYLENLLLLKSCLPLYIEYKQKGYIDEDFFEQNEDYYKNIYINEELFYQNSSYFINNKIYVTNTYPYVLGTIYANRFHEQYENNYEKLKEANDILKVEGQDKLESFLVGEIDNLDDLVAPINKKVMKRR